MMGSGLALAQELVLVSVQPWELGWATVWVLVSVLESDHL